MIPGQVVPHDASSAGVFIKLTSLARGVALVAFAVFPVPIPAINTTLRILRQYHVASVSIRKNTCSTLVVRNVTLWALPFAPLWGDHVGSFGTHGAVKVTIVIAHFAPRVTRLAVAVEAFVTASTAFAAESVTVVLVFERVPILISPRQTSCSIAPVAVLSRRGLLAVAAITRAPRALA